MVPSILDDDVLRRRLEDGSLPPVEFTHQAHLRVAHRYLADEEDFAVAALKFRGALRRYAATLGAPGKYHETITWAYLALLREAMAGRDPDASASALLAERPDLLDHRDGALARIFDVPAVTADPTARRILVFPQRHIARRSTAAVSARTSGS